jgi:anti-sigma-K factor RskA
VTEHDHRQFEEEAGAYLLGALPEAERQAFETHLAGCEACRMDVERLRIAAEALPRSVEQYAAPPSLKSSLMEAVRADTSPKRAPRRSWLPRLRPRLALAAAAVLAAMILSAGFYELGRRTDAERTVAAVVDQERAGQASARLVIPKEDANGAVLEVNGLQRAGQGQIYYVWLRRGDQIVPASIFNVSGDGRGTAGIAGDLDDIDEVMVTRERGLALAPSGPPLLSVKL